MARVLLIMIRMVWRTGKRRREMGQSGKGRTRKTTGVSPKATPSDEVLEGENVDVRTFSSAGEGQE